MDFIFDSKQKKVEIFYEDAELKLILDFIKTQMSAEQNIPSLETNTHSIMQPHLPTIMTIDSDNVPSVVLDEGSDEGGYNCLTAYVPRKTK